MPDRFKYSEVRQKIINALRTDLMGPQSENEILDENPKSSYIIGMLASQTEEKEASTAGEQEVDSDIAYGDSEDYTAGEDDDNEPMASNERAADIAALSDIQMSEIKALILDRLNIVKPEVRLDAENEIDQFIDWWKMLAAQGKPLRYYVYGTDKYNRLMNYYGQSCKDNLNGAACHSCGMISETACENGNRMLDRGLVVPIACRERESYFRELVCELCQLEM